MARSWYSIEPSLTTGGAFAALATLPQAENLKPVKVPANQSNLDRASFVIDSRFVSSTVEASLAYASFFSGTLNQQNRLYMWEFLYYREVTADAPVGGLISGTRYGAAVRIGVHLRNVSLDLSANFVAISAAIALSKAEGSYKIEGVGFGNALGAIAPDLPVSGSFDFEAFGKIIGLGPKLLAWADTNRNQLGFLPLQIEMVRSWDDVAADSAQSVYYAMSRIRKGDSMARAIASMPLGLLESVVRDSYKRVTGTEDPNYPVRGSDEDRAKRWLEFN